MGPARSHRVVGLEGMGVNVNNGGTHPTFLWFASGGSAADAVVDIQVTRQTDRMICPALTHTPFPSYKTPHRFWWVTKRPQLATIG